MSFLPTAVDPVNESTRSRLSSMRAVVTSGARIVGRMLKAPSGTPASASMRPSASADRGVASAGLMIIVQPAAMAAPTLRVIMDSGKFQGVTRYAGPIGCRVARMR